MLVFDRVFVISWEGKPFLYLWASLTTLYPTNTYTMSKHSMGVSRGALKNSSIGVPKHLLKEGVSIVVFRFIEVLSRIGYF